MFQCKTCEGFLGLRKGIIQKVKRIVKDKITNGMTAPDFTFSSPWETSIKLYDYLNKGRALVIFLRYMGCPLCQMKIAELKTDWHRFEEKKVKILVVLQSKSENITGMVEKEDIPFTIICDPDEEIFKLYGVVPGSIFRYITPGVIAKAMKAKKGGFKHGVSEGKEMQLPAVFLIGPDKIVSYAYYGKNVGDVPDNDTLIGILS